MEKILKEWHKKEVSREAVKALCDLYGVMAPAPCAVAAMV